MLLTSGIWGQGFLRAVVFFPVLVSTIGVGITFSMLMHPTRGLFNVSLASIGLHGPGWLTDAHLALYSVALVDLWKGVGLATLIYSAGLAAINPDQYEAARIDGAKPLQIFFREILPRLKPVTVTLIVVQSIANFNDVTNPLYYLPGKQNVTVQLTLFNFQSQFQTQFNLLFMNILLVTILPLIVFIFFNRQIVAGMAAGAAKG